MRLTQDAEVQIAIEIEASDSHLVLPTKHLPLALAQARSTLVRIILSYLLLAEILLSKIEFLMDEPP